jgi:hypothetical protein
MQQMPGWTIPGFDTQKILPPLPNSHDFYSKPEIVQCGVSRRANQAKVYKPYGVRVVRDWAVQNASGRKALFHLRHGPVVTTFA